MFGAFTTRVQGTEDRAKWQGPGGDRLLAALFTGQTRLAEKAAYERLHTGNQNAVGRSTFTVPGLAAIPHPESQVMIEPSDDKGTYIALDGDYLDDNSAQINARREYLRDLFRSFWTSDEVLKHCTSKEFLKACKKNADVPVGAGPGKADAAIDLILQAAEASPDILLFYPEGSEQYSHGVAKAQWLLMHHNDAKGRMIVGRKGKAQTHSRAPRSAGSALADAVS